MAADTARPDSGILVFGNSARISADTVRTIAVGCSSAVVTAFLQA